MLTGLLSKCLETNQLTGYFKAGLQAGAYVILDDSVQEVSGGNKTGVNGIGRMAVTHIETDLAYEKTLILSARLHGGPLCFAKIMALLLSMLDSLRAFASDAASSDLPSAGDYASLDDGVGSQSTEEKVRIPVIFQINIRLLDLK